jgi:lipid-A-disaccharide synthase
MSKRVFLVAGEASGDALGADLIHALRARRPDLSFGGVGGAAMAAAGAPSAVDISGLSVLGIVDGLKAYPKVKKAVRETAEAAAAFAPDAVVLIDSWGFTLRVAQRLRRLLPLTPLIKYIGPQVWATRPGRAKTLARAVDRLICIHDFEAPFYTPYGLPVTVSGAPALGRTRRGDGVSFRLRHNIGAGQEVLLLLPGSRASEIRRVAPVLERAAQALCAKRPNLRVCIVAAEPVRALIEARSAELSFPHFLVFSDEKEDAFAAAEVALAASGTVTTEVAVQETPVIVGYKLGWVTWAVARAFLFKARYATLMNVAAGREVAPEFLQTRFTAKNIARAAEALLTDKVARTTQVAAQNAALLTMGLGRRPAADVAADAVLETLAAGPDAVRGAQRAETGT